MYLLFKEPGGFIGAIRIQLFLNSSLILIRSLSDSYPILHTLPVDSDAFV